MCLQTERAVGFGVRALRVRAESTGRQNSCDQSFGRREHREKRAVELCGTTRCVRGGGPGRPGGPPRVQLLPATRARALSVNDPESQRGRFEANPGPNPLVLVCSVLVLYVLP